MQMTLTDILTERTIQAVQQLYSTTPEKKLIQLQKTRKEFTGDLTLVVFPLLRISKKSPEQTAEDLGNYLVGNSDLVIAFNTIKGFLNLNISDHFYLKFLNEAYPDNNYGFKSARGDAEKVLVEYSSPNTNKPLHLGHIRNILLGYSLSQILKANGQNVVKTNIVNDRGIHICKSMLAWQKWGNEEEPSETKKGDKLVGDYYVRFDTEYKKQIKELVAKGVGKDDAEKEAPLIKEAQDMLRRWESNDPDVHALWEKMNRWVYDGFDVTYQRLGVDFDKIYYESDTYIVGRDAVLGGLEKDIFYRRDDNSVWADLNNEKLDEKLLLRSDGTSVYMTQDIGTAQLRQNDYKPDKMVYVVGNEQNHHFKVLSVILDKLGFSWAKMLYHMSYGMVELPEGKMKSREGTVVDADDLMDEMIKTAHEMADELGKLEGLSEEEKKDNYRIIGMGALKYFILKVDPTKNMTFDPRESIDFNGNTGPFIQYTYARIRSVLRKAEKLKISIQQNVHNSMGLTLKEKGLLKLVYEFPSIVNDAAQNYSPALIANYVYDLVKEYNQFYHDHTIVVENNPEQTNFRLVLSNMVGQVILKGMNLLGIEMPERM
jgi:arginyl-tRNA synthetase